MKRFVCFLVLSLVFYFSVFAEEIEIPHIAVFGTAITEIIPDRMIWHLNASNKGLDLQMVAYAHSALVKKVLILLKEINIPQDNIQTARMNFGENWVYRNRSRVKEGYVANTVISFTVEDLNTYSQLWIELSKISGISISSVNYASSKRIDTQKSTREKALLAAKEKAETLANILSAKLGEILMIKEDLSIERNSGYSLTAQYRYSQSRDNSETSIALGKIPIIQRVKVVFRLLPKN